MGEQKYSIKVWFKSKDGRKTCMQRFFGRTLEHAEDRMHDWLRIHPEWEYDYTE